MVRRRVIVHGRVHDMGHHHGVQLSQQGPEGDQVRGFQGFPGTRVHHVVRV